MECNGDSVSLRERWNAHYHKKGDFFKVRPTMANRTSICIMGALCLSVFGELLLIVIPGLEPGLRNRDDRLNWIATVCVVFGEMAMNWFLTWMDVDSFMKTPSRDIMCERCTDTPPDWHACVACQHDAPPRSHHCKLCQRCVLKRNYHCFFTGSCVGLFNQRRHIVFCFYACVCSIVALWVQLHYLNEVLPIASEHFVTYLAPVTFLKWYSADISTSIFFIFFNTYACMLSAVTSALLFTWEVTLVIRGQVAHEAWHNINTYRADDVWGNIRAVFGSYWLIQFIVPLPTKLPVDGYKWEKAKRLKSK